MRTDTGDLWMYPADYRVITINGNIKKNGRAVMGKGVALQAKQKYQDIDRYISTCLKVYGLNVFIIPCSYSNLIAFPTKYNWYKNSDIKLIEKSAKQLQSLQIRGTIVMPPPGCGNGGLLWTDVEKVISPILDDRFVVLL